MIEIWSKPQCPFCDKAENLCKQKNLEYKKHMLDVDYSREDLFTKFPSARTFPQITTSYFNSFKASLKMALCFCSSISALIIFSAQSIAILDISFLSCSFAILTS